MQKITMFSNGWIIDPLEIELDYICYPVIKRDDYPPGNYSDLFVACLEKVPKIFFQMVVQNGDLPQ